MSAAGAPIDVCLAASGDWSAPTRVNCHEIAERWTAFGRVDYLEPAPMRAPRARDLGRIGRRLAGVAGRGGGPGALTPPPGLAVHRPLYAPWHPTELVRGVNARLAARTLRAGVRSWDVLWFFSPALAGLERLVRARVVIYQAVDDYAANPDVRPALVRRVESELVAAADLVFATSVTLARRLEGMHSGVVLLENVTDVDRLRPLPDTTTPARVAAFVGNLAAHKVDFRLLLDVVRGAPDWTFLLVGPRQGAASEMDVLLARSNVRYLGPRPREELPELLREASVGLLPLPRTALQDSSFPMKVLDYFALGLPVIGPVPQALEPVRKLLVEAEAAGEFVAALERGRMARRDRPFRTRMRREAEGRSWPGRMQELRARVQGVMESRAKSPFV